MPLPTLKQRLEYLRTSENLRLTDDELESMYGHIKHSMRRLRTSSEIQRQLGEMPARDALLVKAVVHWALDVVEREEPNPEWLAELADRFGDGEGLPTMEGYDDCVIGVCTRYGQEPIIAYSYEKVIDKLMADGMTHEEASEWFEFNMAGAWIGDKTYCFVTDGIDDVPLAAREPSPESAAPEPAQVVATTWSENRPTTQGRWLAKHDGIQEEYEVNTEAENGLYVRRPRRSGGQPRNSGWPVGSRRFDGWLWAELPALISPGEET